MSESIYQDTEMFVKSMFSGEETHQELRVKIVKMSKLVRAAIVEHATRASGNTLKVSESIYWILEDLKKYPVKTCDSCSKTFSLSKFLSIRDGYKYQQYCSTSCRSKDPQFASKIANTNLQRYGHKNNMWGTTRDKTKLKWLAEFGVDNPTKRPEVIKKIKNTNLQKLGVEWPAQSKKVRETCKKTILAKYGVENIFMTRKSKDTCLLKYGVENPMQHPPIFEASQRYKRKIGVMPSGNTYVYQGFENVGVESLLAAGLNEDQISIGDVTKIPVIAYWNPVKNKTCVYYPDIFIQTEGRLIEIKSTWTLKNQLDENLAKHLASKKLGFNHEIWVCSKTEVLEIIL